MTIDERLLFDAAPVAMVVCDAVTLAILAANDHASVLYQYDRDALVRLTLLDLAGAGDRRALAEALADVPAAERRVLRERRQCAKDGSVIEADLAISPAIAWGGRSARIVAALDVGASKSVIDALRTDAATGLPNRAALAAADLEGAERGAGVVLIHVTWVGAASQRSQEYRDRSARAVVGVLARLLPANARLSRHADDVYAVLVPGARLRSISAFARHVAAAFERPIAVGDEEIVANPHLGIAVSARPQDAVSLFRDAQAALDYALLGGEAVEVFSDELAGRHDRRAVIERNLRHAVVQRRLTAVYQPIVRLDSGEVVGAEALMRWNCPGIGPVPPSEFIAIAAESSLILRLDEWMLREACAQARRWQLAGFARMHIAVNVSSRAADQREFVRLVATICESVALDPGDLQIELGEDALAPNRGALRNLEALRRLGVRIAIDDFGSGASALSALGSLPLDVIKIDRPFVGPIAADAFRAEVVRSVVSLAHQRGLRVVAEGVETSAQAEVLRTVGCDDAQGFLFGPPVSADDITGRLDRARFQTSGSKEALV
ncbi:MAG: bifunctional diguanylate cyclase/phosphodiesterase [Candidatus Eremiobacteraeota bacterium]|nr:bifunctional diguanylate cyclase/phosphodiesterase [Candidatus Eremiobacteraeota bacterium]